MRSSIFFAMLALLIAGCAPSSGGNIDEQIRSDALARASSDCSAARSCRVSVQSSGDEWIVTVSPTALGMAGDPQFNSGAVHHYHYNASGVFVREALE